MTEFELYHHGILGQKWGIRRFQKKDGSLTSAGRKRVKDLYQESKDDKQEKSPPVKEKTKAEEFYEKVKPASELTNEELEYAIRRVQLEKAYNELTAPKTPPQKSFVEKLTSSKEKIAAVAGTLESAAKAGAAVIAVAKLFGYKTKEDKAKDADKAKAAAKEATAEARAAWEFERKKKDAAQKDYIFNERFKKGGNEGGNEGGKEAESESWREQFNAGRAERAREKARSDAGRYESAKIWESVLNSEKSQSYAKSGERQASSFGDVIWDVPFEDVTNKRSPGIAGLLN